MRRLGFSRRPAQRPTAHPPNIVIIFTDDQGYGDLSCFGHPTIHTPHLDDLAARGMKLTQCYVASPVCSPSRAALLIGCYPNASACSARPARVLEEMLFDPRKPELCF